MKYKLGRGAKLDWLLGREASGAFLMYLILISVMAFVQVQILQIPGYLVFAGYHLIRNNLIGGLSGSAHTVSFIIYLYALAVLSGYLYRLGRDWGSGGDSTRTSSG